MQKYSKLAGSRDQIKRYALIARLRFEVFCIPTWGSRDRVTVVLRQAFMLIIIYFSLCLKTLARVVKHGSLLLYSGGMKLLDSSDYSSYRMPLFDKLTAQ